MSKTRSYVFTLNNYCDDDITNIQKIECPYLIYGKEVGESGTPHLQGFIHFENPRTIKGLKKVKGLEKAHLEVAIAPKEAIVYCKKDGDVFERGTFEQGKRNDLARVYDMVKTGTSVDEVAWNEPSAYDACSRTLMKLEDIRLRKLRRSEMTEGIWVFGKTGMGKSEWAFEQGGDECYIFPFDNDWWDSYKAESVVIIDEFRGQLPYNVLLKMVDKHPNFFVRRRCREPMPFVSKKVIITSSMPPWEVYKSLNKEDSLNQLFRRFKIYEKFEDKVELIDPENYIEDCKY